MSFTQFHHCKPLAGIWGSQRQTDSSKHDFNSYALPPLIIPASNDYGSLPSSPSSPRSLGSFSSVSSSGSPVSYPTASLYNKNDIWGASKPFFADSEPVNISNMNDFHLTPLNDMYERVSLETCPTKLGGSHNINPSVFQTFGSNQVSPQQYAPKPEHYNLANTFNSESSIIESPIESIPSTPTSSTSFDSLTFSPIQSPAPAAHSHSHSRTHSSCNQSINNPTLNTNNSRKMTKKSDARSNKKKLPVNTELYKTEMCASFMKSGGFCPYGDKCQFAHGKHELKSVDRPSNWRSKPCQNWIKTGTCTYNERCCFRHD